MKIIKGLLITLAVVVLILLTGILLIYSSDDALPEEFTYEGQGLQIDDFLTSIDFENLGDFQVGEKEINLILKTSIDMGLADSEDVTVNYVYVDFMPEEFEVVGHATLENVMDFPVRVRAVLSSVFSEGVETVRLERLYLGKVRVPRFAVRQVINRAGIESEYLDKEDLSVTVDLDEMNPYSEVVALEDLWMDDEALHLSIGISNFIEEKVAQPAVEIVTDSIETIYTHLTPEEQAAADVILEYVDSHPDVSADSIGLQDAMMLMEAFSTLSPEAQSIVMEDLEEQLDPEVIQQLEEWMQEFLEE